jgi:hypothetical protein
MVRSNPIGAEIPERLWRGLYRLSMYLEIAVRAAGRVGHDYR